MFQDFLFTPQCLPAFFAEWEVASKKISFHLYSSLSLLLLSQSSPWWVVMLMHDQTQAGDIPFLRN